MLSLALWKYTFIGLSIAISTTDSTLVADTAGAPPWLYLAVLKYTLVLLSIVIGAAFIARGTGATIPFIRVGKASGRNLPVGILFLATGVLIAIFWKLDWSPGHVLIDAVPIDSTK